MRALRANPFNAQKAISIASKVENAGPIEAAFSNEVIGVREVAEVAENITNVTLQTKVFSWALNYSVRDVSRIAAILENTHHTFRIVSVIAQELEKCAKTPHAPSKDVIANLFFNPNISRDKRLGIARYLPQTTMPVLGDALEASLDRNTLPKRAEFLGVPLCAGHFEEIKNAVKNANDLSPKEIAKQLLAVNDIYLERGVLAPIVMPISLSARVLDNLPKDEAVRILIGMSTGALWSYFHLAGFSEEETARLLSFRLD